MASTYLLFSPNMKKFYVGSSRKEDANVRLSHHNNGSVRSTKAGRPWIVVEIERFENYTDARKRELFLKSGIGRKEIYKKFGNLKKELDSERRVGRVV